MFGTRLGILFASKKAHTVFAGVHTLARLRDYGLTDRNILDAIRAALPSMDTIRLAYLIRVPAKGYSVVVVRESSDTVNCVTVIPKGNATPAKKHMAMRVDTVVLDVHIQQGA